MVSSVDAEATESAGGAAVGSDAPIAFADTNATATTSERHRDKRHRDKRCRDKRCRDKRCRDKRCRDGGQALKADRRRDTAR
jgi:hypothetical protein